MTYSDLNDKFNRINDECIRQAFLDLTHTCIETGMTADNTFDYIINGLRNMEKD